MLGRWLREFFGLSEAESVKMHEWTTSSQAEVTNLSPADGIISRSADNTGESWKIINLFWVKNVTETNFPRLVVNFYDKLHVKVGRRKVRKFSASEDKTRL